METIRAQAKEMFPTIYLTLISILQALALESLWSAINEREHLWAWNVEALTGWLQATAVAELIFFLWLAPVHVIVRFRWVVSVRDSLNPFVIGIGEFWLTALIKPDTVHLWFYLLAVGFGFGMWVTWSTIRAARKEPENVQYFRVFAPRPLRYNGPLTGILILCALAGGIVHWLGTGFEALLLVALFNLVLIGLIAYNALGWERSVQSGISEQLDLEQPSARARLAWGRRNR